MNTQNISKEIKNLLEKQKFGVIATQGKDIPYTNLVAFFSTDNMKNIVFATSKKTEKYQNILRNGKMSMLIDNCTNTPSDIENAIVVSAFGSAHEIKQNKHDFIKKYEEKHPYLSDFVKSDDCALIIIKVQYYQYIYKFKEIHLIDMTKNLL